VLGHRNAFFAPIAAVIVLGLGPGNRTRRTIEMVLGVAVGIAVGDVLISAIGTGAAQVGLVVLLAMAASLLLGGGPLVVSQAASSAVLVATVRTSSGGLVPSRFVDALVGGVVGIGVLAVAPRNPAAMVRRAASPVFTELAGTLDDVAAALGARDAEASKRALQRARRGDSLVSHLRQTLELAGETTRIAPTQWSGRAHIARYADAASHLELAVRNSRVIARAAVRAVELEASIAPMLPAAIHQLAMAVRQLEHDLNDTDGDGELRQSILDAVTTASQALNEPRGFAIDVLVGQVRSLATDLLRALGLEQAAAVEQVRAAAGEREGKPPRSPRSPKS
jgi:uncharacterized membrane protein YgaE (UPF0421/DUF939 family)